MRFFLNEFLNVRNQFSTDYSATVGRILKILSAGESFSGPSYNLTSDEMLKKTVDSRPDHKNLFWNFRKCQAVLCYILIDKQMLH